VELDGWGLRISQEVFRVNTVFFGDLCARPVYGDVRIDGFPEVTMHELPSVVEIKTRDLRERGFTDSGAKQFTTAVSEFAQTLLKMSINVGEAFRAPNAGPEIGRDHVRTATLSLARSSGNERRSVWSVVGQVAEYVATAIAGIGGGHLDKKAGIAAFGLGIFFALVLLVSRLTFSKGE
jgi:hypothetical protein